MYGIFLALHALVVVATSLEFVVVIWVLDWSLPLLLDLLASIAGIVVLTNDARSVSNPTLTSCVWLLAVNSRRVGCTLVRRVVLAAGAVGWRLVWQGLPSLELLLSSPLSVLFTVRIHTSIIVSLESELQAMIA